MAFQCTKCKHNFRSKAILNQHMNLHDTKSSYKFKCTHTDCNKAFNQMQQLKTHLNMHTGNKPFSCTECSKQFTCKSDLTVHIRTHTGEKPFKCTVCTKSFTQNISRKNHMKNIHKIHTDTMSFPCTECSKKFISKSNLTKHIRTHTGEKPFKCTVCTESFSQNISCKNHMKYIHKMAYNNVCIAAAPGPAEQMPLQADSSDDINMVDAVNEYEKHIDNSKLLKADDICAEEAIRSEVEMLLDGNSDDSDMANAVNNYETLEDEQDRGMNANQIERYRVELKLDETEKKLTIDEIESYFDNVERGR